MDDDDKRIAIRERAEKDRKKKITTFEKIQKKMNQTQKISITKAALKDLGGTDNSKININYQPIMIVSEGNKEEDKGILAPIPELRELVWAVLEQLPNPKLQNLRKLAIITVVEKLQSQTKAAKYLNMQRTYMSRIMSEAEKDGLFSENLTYHKSRRKCLVESEVEGKTEPLEIEGEVIK